MSLGAIFVGVAVAIIVAVYIAQPFRHTTTNPDAIIEAWIAKLPPASPPPATPTPTLLNSPPPPTPTLPYTPTPPPAHSPTPLPAHTDTQVNFCPQCGRRVTSEYRFCPGCGALLPHEEGAA